jgi:hypothetical protein
MLQYSCFDYTVLTDVIFFWTISMYIVDVGLHLCPTRMAGVVDVVYVNIVT